MSKNWSRSVRVRLQPDPVRLKAGRYVPEEDLVKSSMWLFAAVVVIGSLSAQGGISGASAAPQAAPRAGGQGAAAARPPGAAGTVIVFETVKGAFEVELYPGEAPKSVEHILALVKRNFYNGLRVHRLVPGFVVQFGDPQTRDMTKRALWGNGGSGRKVGVAEVSPKRPHRLGAVALARPENDPGGGDSQIYIALAGLESPRIAAINGKYTVIGQVTSGLDVVRKLQVPDVIRRATVKK
jgi:cyclophilin family peptidyl-prolyl cis-trans isomerase